MRMKIIKSSEIASYVFCPASWWIGRTKGVKFTKSMQAGERHHQAISENQPKARVLHICLTVTVIIVVALIIYRFLG